MQRIATRFRHHRLFVLCLSLFIILSAIVFTGVLIPLDISTRLFVRQSISERAFLPIADFLDQVFKFRMVVPVFVLSLFLFARTRYGLKIFLAFFSMFAIEVLAKLFIPQHTFSGGPYIKNFAGLLPFGDLIGDLDVARFPFPSGHVARTVFFALLILGVMGKYRWFKTKQWIVAVLFICLTVVVSISRMYLFRHWLTDVLGGLLLGAGFGWIVYDIVISFGPRQPGNTRATFKNR